MKNFAIFYEKYFRFFFFLDFCSSVQKGSLAYHVHVDVYEVLIVQIVVIAERNNLSVKYQRDN